MKNLAILFAIAALSLGGCSWWSSTPESSTSAVTKESVANAIKAAENAQKKTNSAGGEWRDTEKIIKEAKTALEKGDLQNAMKLAKEAEAQSNLGHQQATDQKNAKPWLF